MLSIDNNKISLTRGDTAYLTVPIKNDLYEQEYIMSPEDTLTFSVKKTIKDTEYVFQKVSVGKNIIHILPTDTTSCEFGTYKYDVQLTKANGDVFTIIEPTDFNVTAEVTT